MNYRFKEIKLDVTRAILKKEAFRGNNSGSYDEEEWLELFAEAIIKECIAVAGSGMRMDVGEKIGIHFDVTS